MESHGCNAGFSKGAWLCDYMAHCLFVCDNQKSSHLRRPVPNAPKTANSLTPIVLQGGFDARVVGRGRSANREEESEHRRRW